jgi:WD40 repeat protein
MFPAMAHMTLPATVRSLAFSPDALIAAGCDDGNVYLVNLSTFQMCRPAVLEGPGGDVLTVAFSPDGLRLASGGTDRELALWKVDTLEHMMSKPFPDELSKVVWSPPGDRFMAVSGELISVWGMGSDGSFDQETWLSGTRVVDATWSLDGAYFAAVTADRTFAIWDAVRSRDVFVPMHLADEPTTVTWLPAGVAVGTKTGDVHVFSPVDGRLLSSNRLSNSPIEALRWASTLRSDTVAASDGHTLSVVNADGARAIASLPAYITALSADGQTVASAQAQALRLLTLPSFPQRS